MPPPISFRFPEGEASTQRSSLHSHRPSTSHSKMGDKSHGPPPFASGFFSKATSGFSRRSSVTPSESMSHHGSTVSTVKGGKTTEASHSRRSSVSTVKTSKSHAPSESRRSSVSRFPLPLVSKGGDSRRSSVSTVKQSQALVPTTRRGSQMGLTTKGAQTGYTGGNAMTNYTGGNGTYGASELDRRLGAIDQKLEKLDRKAEMMQRAPARRDDDHVEIHIHCPW